MARRRAVPAVSRGGMDWLLRTTSQMVRCRSVSALLDLAYDAIRDGLGYDRVGLSLVDVRVFAGYAGWSGGQLEDEIEQGAWWVLDAQPVDAMTDDPDRLWRAVLRRQPPPLRRFADYPEDPSAT